MTRSREESGPDQVSKEVEISHTYTALYILQ